MSIEKFKNQILEYVQGKNYSPTSHESLLKSLHIDPDNKKKFQKALEKLLDEEILVLDNGHIVYKKTNKNEMIGNFFLHARGFGFVQPEEGSKVMENVFIPRDYTQDAITDDVVLIKVNAEKSAKGYEGKILKILKRKTKAIIGTVIFLNQKDVELFCPVLGKKKKIVMKRGKAKIAKGDRLQVKVLSWGNTHKPIQTKFEKNLGSIKDPAVDIPIAIIEHDIHDPFNKSCLAEAKKCGHKVLKKDLKHRIDYTKLQTVTIDPDTAKDFDDALSLTIDNKGHFHLGVHIADVSHYVGIDSALDKEALQRANSTYLPGKCVPMIPESLSNGLCSLKPNVIRLSASVMMQFDPSGNLLDYQIQKSFIESDKRFTYKEALEVLEKKQKSPFLELLENLKKLALLLKEKRRERGSIDFALPEGFIHLDKDGNPTHIERIEYDITHQMVEEFMLKANEVVATHLHHQIGKAIFRIHEEPDIENFENLFDLASRLGFSLSKNPDIKDVKSIFDQAKNSRFLPILSIQFIRSLKLAMYSPDNVGHFGLSLEYYCHFTSPIRRYSDLVIHRLLFCQEYDGALEKISLICSEGERKSMRAESSVILLKKLRLLENERKKDPTKTYTATITRILPMRIVFDVEEFFMEGSCHVSELYNDYYEFVDDVLYGKDTGTKLAFGDKIKVKIDHIDLTQLEASWTTV